MAIQFLENGWYIEVKVESGDKSDSDGERKVRSIGSIIDSLSSYEWSNLSRNPNAISLLEQNLDKIDWWSLSENPNAKSILECNLDKIDWEQLSMNANIFEDEDIACK